MVFFDPTNRRWLYVAGAFCVAIALALAAALFAQKQLQTPHTVARAPIATAEFGPRAEKVIALTFDDGPNPRHTPPLIRFLESQSVPATFFLIGEHVLQHPRITRTLVEKGFEIGNHSFSHEHSIHDDPERIRKEIVSTDQAIFSVTGRSTMLYRPPFLLDVGFGIPDGRLVNNENLRVIEDIGLFVVSADIDTTDWEQESVYDAEEVYSILLDGVSQGKQIILMHDQGGNGATLEALRKFVPEMKAAGYTFVPVSHFFGLSTDDAMPRVESTFASNVVSAVLVLTFNAEPFVYVIAGILGSVGLLRMCLILTSVRFMAHRSRKSRQISAGTLPSITVLVPAYNEAANIEATLLSVLHSTVTPTQIIVIDDGSTDDTARVVRNVAETSPLITLLQKQNGGTKAGALQYASPHVTGDITISIDGDTVIDAHAIERLVPHFADPAVGAVAGKIYPARTRTLIEKLQYLEYVQGQNLDKKIFALGNSVGIVPGALGAWRTNAIHECGGYSTDTVVEDQDLTLALLARGYQVLFEPLAHAFTETPISIRSFFTQRLRWMYGTVQCFYKYDHWFLSADRPWLGFVVLPNLLFFNVIFPIGAPVFDMIAIAGILGIVNAPTVVTIFFFFLTLEFVFAFEGMRQERFPRFSYIALVPIQRFFYQYVTAFAVWRSIAFATSGSLVRWGRLTRHGTAALALRGSALPLVEPIPVLTQKIEVQTL